MLEAKEAVVDKNLAKEELEQRKHVNSCRRKDVKRGTCHLCCGDARGNENLERSRPKARRLESLSPLPGFLGFIFWSFFGHFLVNFWKLPRSCRDQERQNALRPWNL